MNNNDQKLISALRRNGRESISNLAIELGMSRATVRTRIEKLISSGEILGFTAVLKGDQTELPVRGILLIRIEGKGSDRIIAKLNGMSEIQSIHTTNGRWDVVVDIATNTLQELDSALREIRMIDGVAATETSLYLSTKRANSPAGLA